MHTIFLRNSDCEAVTLSLYRWIGRGVLGLVYRTQAGTYNRNVYKRLARKLVWPRETIEHNLTGYTYNNVIRFTGLYNWRARTRVIQTSKT